MEHFTQLLASPGFMPHGHCFLWTPTLLWAYVLSDSLIALAYYSIPVALWYFVRRRSDLPFGWVFIMFAVFIFACGTTHLMAIWNIWQPVYWLDAAIKAATATASVATATLLWPLMPRALALPSQRQLTRVNEELRQQVLARRLAEERLQELNEALERRVAERTAALEAANMELRALAAERERASRSLQESQQLLQAIVDNVTAIVYVKRLDGRYLLVNRQYQQLFHVTQQEMSAKTDFDLFDAEHAQAFRSVDEEVAASDRAIETEEVAPLDDGPHVYLSIKFPVRDELGRPYAVAGISTDITERKRNEQALRENEERTRAILDAALDAVITMDAQGTITGWNPQAEATFGWPREEVLGLALGETIIPPQHRSAHANGLRRYLSTGHAVVLRKRLELTALHRDGHEFPVELTITPIGSGAQVRFSGFARDISDRKRSEAALKAQIERLNLLDRITRAIGERQDLHSIFQVVVRALEDQLPLDFVCMCRHEDGAKTLEVTAIGARSQPLAQQLTMTEQSSIVVDENGLSQCIRGRLVYEPDLHSVPQPFAQRLARAGLRSLVAVPLMAQGQAFSALIASRHQTDGFSSGECEFLRQLCEHVALAAQQAQLYAALQEAYQELRQTQQAVLQQERLRALGQMASGIAHDINNALSPVTLYTESLLDQEAGLSERARGYLMTIEQAVADISATVARMREFYREREPQLSLVPLLLNQLVQQVVELTRARWSDMAQQRGVVIEVHTELAESLPYVSGMESEIREALINLIFNAVDAMPQGGRLTLRTGLVVPPPGSAPVPTKVKVQVVDDGMGMDEETRRRCLEPFFTTKGERGTGLGLAMVYGMAQRHGADIDIASAVSQGTTVSLTFPSTANGEAAAPGSAKQPPVPAGLRLLVVDDDPVVLQSLGDVLRGDGHVVVAVSGGQAGIDAFTDAFHQGGAFSAVITDLGMPYVDGRRVASAVKRIAPSTPVLLITGWGQRMIAEGDIPEHVDRVLSKPARLGELREALALCRPVED
ncbi:MAG TPA: PAS domain S-box protein [Methylibium sp.]